MVALLGLVFVTTGQNFSEPATGTSDAIIALDAKTGAVRWVNQRLPNDIWNVRFPHGPEHPDYDIGDSPQIYRLPNGQTLIGCYHPSRQNTNTGKLTPAQMDDVFRKATRALKA